MILSDKYVKENEISIGDDNKPIILTFHIIHLDLKQDTKVFPYAVNRSNSMNRLYYIASQLLNLPTEQIRIHYKKFNKQNKAYVEYIQENDYQTQIFNIFNNDIENDIYIENKKDTYKGQSLARREIEKETSSIDLTIYIQNKDEEKKILLSKSFLMSLQISEFNQILEEYIPKNCKEYCLEYTLSHKIGIPDMTLSIIKIII